MKHLSMLVLIPFMFASVASSAQKSSDSAEQIINKMLAVYASCNSYTDEGENTTVFFRNNRKQTVLKPFSTSFVRPSNFRFEYKDRYGEYEWNRNIIWKESDSIKIWRSVNPQAESQESLQMALGTAAGSSSRISNTISPLLFQAERGMTNRFILLKDLKLLGDEKVGNYNAHKIEGTDSSGKLLTIWIDTNKLLVVKLFQKTKFDDFETESTTIYRPEINTKVDKEKPAFGMPETEK